MESKDIILVSLGEDIVKVERGGITLSALRKLEK